MHLCCVDDPLLVALRNMVEAGEVRPLAITLTVHGVVIAGNLCSRAEYEVEVEKRVDRGGSPHENGYSVFHNEMREQEEQAKAQGLETFREAFVHLKDAQYLNVGIAKVGVELQGMPWRGKLSSIDGYSLACLLTRRDSVHGAGAQ